VKQEVAGGANRDQLSNVRYSVYRNVYKDNNLIFLCQLLTD